MINYSLAREIYNTPWLMDAQSFGSLFGMMSSFRSGNAFESTEKKLNSSLLYNLKSVSFSEDNYDLRKLDQDAEIINVLNIDGPITKGGGASSYGTKEMANQMLTADNDNRVKGHMIRPDSGGGSSKAVEFMTDAIKEATKPVVTFIEKGAIAGSAAYAIIAASDYIIVEKSDVSVGSIGTYMEFAGLPKQAELPDGEKYFRIYATKSTDKNKWYEDAVNDGNIKTAIEEVLDPTNNKFIEEVLSNRPNATELQLRGGMFDAGDVIGTLVDEIGGFQTAVDKILSLSKDVSGKNKSNKASEGINSKLNNNTKMTVEQLKSDHPDTYNSIFNAGISAEKDRCGAWLAHNETDSKAVAEGISSGEQISNTQREQFFVKQNSIKRVEVMKSDSKGDLNTPESKLDNKLTPEQVAAKKIEDSFIKPSK